MIKLFPKTFLLLNLHSVEREKLTFKVKHQKVPQKTLKGKTEDRKKCENVRKYLKKLLNSVHSPPPPSPPSEVPKTDALMQIKSKFEPIAAKRFLQA